MIHCIKYVFMIIAPFTHFLLLAHPHVFIDNRVYVIFDDNGLTGLRHEWFFDEMFSGSIIQEFDIDANGKFDEKEIKNLKKGAFSNLKEHHYFTDLTINGEEFQIKEVESFTARIAEGVMIYKFFLPCELNATLKKQEIKIAVYDPTYYVQVLWVSENPYLFEDTLRVELEHEIVENEEKAYYYGQIIPEVLKIKFKKKQ